MTVSLGIERTNLRQYFTKTAIDILRGRIMALEGPMDDVHGFISVSKEGDAIIVEILGFVGQEMLPIHVLAVR